MVEVGASRDATGDFAWEHTHSALKGNPYQLLHNIKSFTENAIS